MIGTTLQNRYRIEAELGRGGMGEVYRATDLQNGDTVAIKALKVEVLNREPDLLARFIREGEALRALNHPNIVRMIAALEEGGRHYLVMEFVEGGSLKDILSLQKNVPYQSALHISLDLADALTRAHRLGIIHRDLKPANVLIAKDGTPRLADFGIAHMESDQPLTQTGVVMGTMDYLSPEVCEGERPDERSDIWAFGVMLFEMLSGQLPFEGNSITAKLAAILTQPLPDLALLAPETPLSFIHLIKRMLEKDPQLRIPSVRLVGAELEAILKGRPSVTPTHTHPASFRDFGIDIEFAEVNEAFSLLKPETKIDEQVEGEPPYMGLRYFDTHDADLFYGREALTRELLARAQKESFLAIVGASGSGKSSVARAGLIPAWQKENARGAVHVITPTAHPLESLAASLTRTSESVTATSTLMDDLKNDSRSLRLYVKKTFGEIKLLLLVDQFEETFTLCKDQAERKAFIENLSSLTSDEGTARVVITLRADFYHHCAEYEGLRQTLQIHQAYIGAMTADELRQAITTPAETNGWYFQPGLVDLILQDVGTEPGALPLLSHALLETWKRRQGRTMTLQGYHEAGGVKKAIAQTAESVYDRLTPAEQLIARGIFLRLIELSENTQDTRRRVKMDELSFAVETQDSVLKVLKILTDARLITTEQDSAEVSHEALIREWGTLRRWLDEDREGLRLHYHLTESAHEWQSRGRESSELYRGARLKQIQNWAKDHGGLLSLLEEEFLSASQNMQNRERLQWAILACVVVTLLLAITLAQTGYINRFIYKPIDMENYWVTIPAGEFQMGSTYKEIAEGEGTCQICDAMDEKPRHLVSLDTYQIGKYEITIRQYTQCVRAGVCTGTYDIGDDKETYPAINVNWDDAMTFCAWVGGRLPTEAEWEKAARGVDGRIYPWEGDPSAELLNYRNNNGGIVEIGSYPNGVSPYGIFDLAGNVWEWVYDWYSESYYSDSPKENPTGPETGIYRVLRGGSWNDGDSVVRSANRHFQYPSNSNGFIGFRCARDLP